MKQLIQILMVSLLMSGCATGFMTSYSYDPKVGRETKTVYSPLFSSGSAPLAEGAEFRISVVITRRVEPISYNLFASIGGLTAEDLESKATAVVHFKNDSQQIYKITLRKINIGNNEFAIRAPEIILKPGDRLDTKEVVVKAPTYNTAFSLNLQYDLNGQSMNKSFSVRRQTMEELAEKEKKKKVPGTF